MKEYDVSLQERLILMSFKGPGFNQIRLGAATVVLLHHSREIEYADIRIDPLFHYSGGFIHFGSLAVIVFFALSGFLVTASVLRSENMIDFVSRRIVRIFPPLIVVVIGSMMLVGPMLTSIPLTSYFADLRLYLYAKNILTLTYDFLPGVVNSEGHPVYVNGPLWILHFEVMCYVVLALASMLGLLRRRSLFLAVVAICYGIYLAINLDPTLVAEFPNRFLTFIRLFVYFGAGAALFLFADRVAFSMSFVVAALALSIAALPVGVGAVVLPFTLPYILIYCGFSVLPGQSLVKRDLSYGVYLTHAPILVAFMVSYPRLRIWWLVAAIAFVISLGLSYLCWTFVEEPALKRKEALAKWLNYRWHALCCRWQKLERGRVGT